MSFRMRLPACGRGSTDLFQMPGEITETANALWFTDSMSNSLPTCNQTKSIPENPEFITVKGEKGEQGIPGQQTIFWSGNAILGSEPQRVLVFPVENAVNNQIKLSLVVDGVGVGFFSVKSESTDAELCQETRVFDGGLSVIKLECDVNEGSSILGLYASGENLSVVSTLIHV